MKKKNYLKPGQQKLEIPKVLVETSELKRRPYQMRETKSGYTTDPTLCKHADILVNICLEFAHTHSCGKTIKRSSIQHMITLRLTKLERLNLPAKVSNIL